MSFIIDLVNVNNEVRTCEIYTLIENYFYTETITETTHTTTPTISEKLKWNQLFDL